MNQSAPSLVKLENNHAYEESLYFEEQPPEGAWEQPSFVVPDCFGQCAFNLYNWDSYQLPWQNNNVMPCLEFKDFEDISGDFFGLWPDFNKPFFEEEINIADAKPLNYAAGEKCDHQELNIETVESFRGEVSNNINNVVSLRSLECFDSEEEYRLLSGRYNKSLALQLDEIQKYFDVPITKAAKELKVGLTVLKKRCRELNILRWPHRKIKSLKSLIDNAKVQLQIPPSQSRDVDNAEMDLILEELGLASEIAMLEEHKRMIQKLPAMELTERTKKLRQACFKANYKKRRALAAAAAAVG
ncbi:hypothetical protein ACH5RR_019808 [Cinchona calisaya]|uniref:RWP-RK domain-containing protein n=1 Tax=Cinchona calisaya TaxID=153742 RepID=A0ABD2ZRC2_9GENT